MLNTTPRAYAPSNIDGLAQIGPTRHALMGIRYVEGEGGGEGTGQEQQQNQDGQQQNESPWTKDNFDPDRAFRLVENLRKDLADTKAKTATEIAAAAAKAAEDAQKATLAQFAKLLTGEQEPETDPAKLNEALTRLQGTVTEKDTALTEAQNKAKAADRALAVAIAAPALGADTTKLLANEDFKNSIASVEPTDQAAIQAAITKAVQDTPTLKATPSRSGSGEHQGATVQSLEAQLKTAQDSGNQAEVIRLTREVVAARNKAAGITVTA